MRIPCDLHLHTVFSDGHLTPTAVVEEAYARGLSVIAITDHDTVAGVEEGIAAAKRLGITCLGGIEFSTYLREEVHVLGYNVPYDDVSFLDEVARLQGMRRRRIQRVVEKLHKHGIKLVVHDELSAPTAGRAHVAELLVKQGFVRSKAEAFDKYLGKGAPCYVEGMRVTPADAVRLIHAYGGVAVLAHPYRFLQGDSLERMVKELVPLGLNGIETYYPNYGESVRGGLARVAVENGLIITGGSDFHGGEGGTTIGCADAHLDEKACQLLGLTKC